MTTTQAFREAPAEPAGPTAAQQTSRSTAYDSRLGRLRRVPAERWALGGLLAATALLYLWGLGASGYANSFYSAAAQAGSQSWKAFFFGSFDSANSITVDKTPLSLWPMGLSVRIFGLSSWSILVPQALEGVATVALLHASVRRTTGSARAGLLAGAAMALTPVAVLMFRFDNPDSALVLLLVGSVYATQRAIESTRLRAEGASAHPVRWIALGGALVGLGFLAKMLQAFLVLPALAIAYAVFASVPLWRRFGDLLIAFGSMILAGGWWIAIVSLWPASSRPFIGGSQDNSILELTFGYNGFGRLTGNETGSVGGGGAAANGGGSGMWGQTGLLRMFDSEIGGQVAWLIPAALVLGIGGLAFARRGLLASEVGAGLTVWLGWLLVTGLTFSLMAGIFHAYYTVALAPAVAALVAIGGHVLWGHRSSLVASGLLAGTVALTAAFSFMLLDRAAGFHPWLKYAVVVLGLLTAVLLAGVRHLPRRIATVVAAAAVVTALAGPAAYSLSTASTPHTGSIPTAGPSTGGFGGPGGPGGFGGFPTLRGQAPTGGTGGGTGTGGTTTGGATAGGLLQSSTSSDTLTTMLQTDAEAFTWAAAAFGSNSAAGYQLASEEPVMPLGGFNGSDPSPTLAQFQTYVANGEIHYFIAGGGGFGGGGFGGGGGGSQMGGSSDATDISTWVSDNFTATTVDGVTVYDLSTGVR